VVYALYFAVPHLEIFDVRIWSSTVGGCGMAGLAWAAVYAGVLRLCSCVACLIFRRQGCSETCAGRFQG